MRQEEQMKEIKLKPNEVQACPFCGTFCDTEVILHDLDIEKPSHAVFCIGCFGYGPSSETEKGAVERWNDRPLERYLLKCIQYNDEIIESSDHIAEGGKEVEEKKPLKLRVGGVYKRRDGGIEEIARQDKYAPEDSVFRFESKNGYHYAINGNYMRCSECIEDLIEEVQPEDDKCKCEGEGAIVYTTTNPTVCVRCNKENEQLLKNHKTIIPDLLYDKLNPYMDKTDVNGYGDTLSRLIKELESLRKENAELKEFKLKYEDEYILTPEELARLANSQIDTSDLIDEQLRPYAFFTPLIAKLRIHNDSLKQINEIYQRQLKRYTKERDELIAKLKKTEGNPFKVEDEVKIFMCNCDEKTSYSFKGKIKLIHGDSLWVDIGNSYYWYHYKQCEAVDEN